MVLRRSKVATPNSTDSAFRCGWTAPSARREVASLSGIFFEVVEKLLARSRGNTSSRKRNVSAAKTFLRKAVKIANPHEENARRLRRFTPSRGRVEGQWRVARASANKPTGGSNKRRRPMPGLKSFRTAAVVSGGNDAGDLASCSASLPIGTARPPQSRSGANPHQSPMSSRYRNPTLGLCPSTSCRECTPVASAGRAT